MIFHHDVGARHVEALLEPSKARTDPVGEHVVRDGRVRGSPRQPVRNTFRAPADETDNLGQFGALMSERSTCSSVRGEHRNGAERRRGGNQRTQYGLSHGRPPARVSILTATCHLSVEGGAFGLARPESKDLCLFLFRWARGSL